MVTAFIAAIRLHFTFWNYDIRMPIDQETM